LSVAEVLSNERKSVYEITIPASFPCFDIPYGPGVSDSLFVVMNKDGAADPNTAWEYTPSMAPVPEPGMMALFAVGLFALGFGTRGGPFLIDVKTEKDKHWQRRDGLIGMPHVVDATRQEPDR
jgi:hypothetical protein